jgi:hypothetical protein
MRAYFDEQQLVVGTAAAERGCARTAADLGEAENVTVEVA